MKIKPNHNQTFFYLQGKLFKRVGFFCKFLRDRILSELNDIYKILNSLHLEKSATTTFKPKETTYKIEALHLEQHTIAVLVYSSTENSVCTTFTQK